MSLRGSHIHEPGFVHATFVHAPRRLRLRGERLREVRTDVRAAKLHTHGIGLLVVERVDTAKASSLLRGDSTVLKRDRQKEAKGPASRRGLDNIGTILRLPL